MPNTPARLRKKSDLITYTKLTYFASEFLKELHEKLRICENKPVIYEIERTFTKSYFKAAFALSEADETPLNNKKREELQKAAKVQVKNLQSVINLMVTIDSENLSSLFMFSTYFSNIEGMIVNWIKSDKKRREKKV